MSEIVPILTTQARSPAPAAEFITASGYTDIVVPENVTVMHVSACAPGGGGGGGEITAEGTSGGGGAASGHSCFRFPVKVTPGDTVTVYLPPPGTGGAANSNGVTAGNLTIAGTDSIFPTLFGGNRGAAGSVNVGGTGGNGFPSGSGSAGGAAKTTATNTNFYGDQFYGGCGGGGGGDSGANAGNGGNGGSWGRRGAGGGANGGGGGGSSHYGDGGDGAATGNSTAPAAPNGYGGGGGGGGANGPGGDGAPGFVLLEWI